MTYVDIKHLRLDGKAVVFGEREENFDRHFGNVAKLEPSFSIVRPGNRRGDTKLADFEQTWCGTFDSLRFQIPLEMESFRSTNNLFRFIPRLALERAK